MHRPVRSLVVALLLTSTGLAACGDGDPGAGAAETSGASPETTSAGPGGTAGTEAPEGGPGPAGGQAQGGTSVPSTQPERDGPEVQVVELTFSGGQVTSGAGRVAVAAGSPVRLEVTSDVDEEVHVHGYDIEVPVAAGATTTIELVGDLPGVWEVELHDSGQLLCELEIAG